MVSYRLNFIDTDQSFNIPVADTSVQGYMTVRAPKGTAEPIYFPKGSATDIHSMIGIPTADWKDIQDAIDFNNSFGLWISAPAGTSSEYPSYFGGSYLTTRGVFEFFEVTDKDELNYRALVPTGDEEATYLHDGSNDSLIEALIDSSGLSTTHSISISEIDLSITNNAIGLAFDYWGNDHNAPATYTLTVSGNKLVATDPDGAIRDIGTINGSTIIIAGTDGATSFMPIDFGALVSTDGYVDPATSAFLDTPTHNIHTYQAEVVKALLSRLNWIIDVSKDTILSIVQKSPTEKLTNITITDIGYDKYLYDESLSVYFNELVLPGRTAPYPSPEDANNADGLYVVINEDEGAHGSSGIYKYTADRDAPTNVTGDYRDSYIKINGAGLVRDMDGNIIGSAETNPEAIEAAAYLNTIYYVNTAGQLILADGSAGINPKIDNTYNTVTFSVEEEVTPGVLQPGGTFHGSVDESGKDSYGADIYFPNVLPDSAISFVEVIPNKKLDEWVDDQGIYTEYRIVDRKAGPFVATTQLKGQRYVTKIQEDLVASGIAGGANVEEYAATLREGWAMASSATYDVVDIFMEPTGIELLKEDLYALRLNTHKLSTMVSARILSTAEATNPSSIVVTGRLTGTAQYVNEFQRKDAYTGKKYWSSLIGAVGTKLAKIMQDKMGGAAPMFTDISGLGGQLAVSVLKAKYEWTQEQQKILDDKGVNTIILNPTYGLMIVNQKTTQDPTNLTDWSYLGHSMAFDRFKREIRDAVMIPQIGKPNIAYYQQMRQQQADVILARRTSGLEPIWAEGKIYISSVNTAEVKAQRKFVIKAVVKVNVFSEYVELELVNVAQTTSV